MIDLLKTETFDKWFKGLRDARAKVRIDARIERLANGNPGDARPVGNGVNELRIDYGPGYRGYFVQRGNVLIILLCGGDKASQRRDIAKAIGLAERLRP